MADFTPTIGLGGYINQRNDYIYPQIGGDPAQRAQDLGWDPSGSYDDRYAQVMADQSAWKNKYDTLEKQFQQTLDPREWAAIQQEMVNSQAQDQKRFNRGKGLTLAAIGAMAGGAYTAGGGLEGLISNSGFPGTASATGDFAGGLAGAPDVGSGGYSMSNETYIPGDEGKFLGSAADYAPAAQAGNWQGEGDSPGMSEQLANLGGYEPSFMDTLASGFGNIGSQINSFFGDITSGITSPGTGGNMLDSLWKKKGLIQNLASLYSNYTGNKQQGQLAKNLSGLYGPNSAYAQQLQKTLQRQDAQSGRRSQYGPRSVELQARLADVASRQAGTLSSIYAGQTGSRNNMLNAGLNLLDMFAPKPKAGG